MNCFPCFSSEKSDSEEGEEEQLPVAQPKEVGEPLLPLHRPEITKTAEKCEIAAKAFTLREMAMATKNFRQECLIYDDGFGRVFKGTLKSSGEDVAIKQLDRNGIKESKEFLDEVATLSPLRHPNLTSIVGYCADGDQRILVYEYMPLGSLENHLLARPEDGSTLDWVTRMKIATGAAQGLQYLHEEANPPVIYRDFKSSYILLDEGFKPRLCYFGLTKLGESGNTTNVPPRVMGTYGYSAPEYARTGELTMKSDIYSFGVILLELISGRRAIDPDRPANEQNLVTWAQPIFRDPRRFPEMADPLLRLDFSVKSLNQAIGVAAMCLQEEPTVRPYITDVVAALSFLDFDANDTPASSPSSGKESVEDACDGDTLDNESESSFSNQEDDDDNDYDDDKSNSSSDHEEIVGSDNDDDQSTSSSDHEELVSNDYDDEKCFSSSDHEEVVNSDYDDDKSNSFSGHEEIVNSDYDDDKSNNSSDHEEIVKNDYDDDKSNSSPDHEEIVNNENDDDKSNNSSDREEIPENDNDDDKCSSSLDHEDNGNKESCAHIYPDHEDNENISETHDDHHASFSDDNDNSNEIPDDISGYSMDDEDTALTIEIVNGSSSSDILLGEDNDDDEIQQNMRIKSTNSKKGKVMEISDDESIYSSSSSRSSSSSIDFKLGENKTTQKAKSTKKSSVDNSSTMKSKNRWRSQD